MRIIRARARRRGCIRQGPDAAMAVVLRLEPFHHLVLTLPGPTYEEFNTSTN